MSRFRLAAFALACLAQGAQAHVSLETADASAGRPYKGVLRIGHGCDGAATTAISFEPTDALTAVKPMPKPGWTLKTEPGRITWSGGRLLDTEYDEFVFVSQIAPNASGTLALPVVQTCEKGEQRWVETPAAGQAARDLKFPAPVLRIAATEQKPVASGPVRIEQAWSRATPGGATIGAGYLRITNTSSAPDRLLGGATDIAARIEPHDMKMEDGIMKMRLLGGIDIAPGATIELKPGGMHLMIVGLKQPLQTGASFKAVLQFEKAGATPVTFNVLGMGASAPGAAGAGAEPEIDHSKHMQHMHGN